MLKTEPIKLWFSKLDFSGVISLAGHLETSMGIIVLELYWKHSPKTSLVCHRRLILGEYVFIHDFSARITQQIGTGLAAQQFSKELWVFLILYSLLWRKELP